MKELSKTWKVTIAVVIIAIVFLVFFILNLMMKMTDPGPPDFTQEQKESWYPTLQCTRWKIDKVSKDSVLEELLCTPIKTLQFSQWDGMSEDMSVLLESDVLTYFGVITKGENALILDVDGAEMELWYSTSENNTYPVV
ncbi:MAG: hypothetical protein ACI4NM_12345, partial [Bullifex sp.]